MISLNKIKGLFTKKPEETVVRHQLREFRESWGEKRYYPGSLLEKFCKVGDTIQILQEKYDGGGRYYFSDDRYNPCTIEEILDSGILELKQKDIPGLLVVSSQAIYWRKIQD